MDIHVSLSGWHLSPVIKKWKRSRIRKCNRFRAREIRAWMLYIIGNATEMAARVLRSLVTKNLFLHLSQCASKMARKLRARVASVACTPSCFRFAFPWFPFPGFLVFYVFVLRHFR